MSPSQRPVALLGLMFCTATFKSREILLQNIYYCVVLVLGHRQNYFFLGGGTLHKSWYFTRGYRAN